MLVKEHPNNSLTKEGGFLTTLTRQDSPDPHARRKRYLEVPVRLQRPDGRVRQPDMEERPVAGAGALLSAGESVEVLLPQRSHRWLFSALRS